MITLTPDMLPERIQPKEYSAPPDQEPAQERAETSASQEIPLSVPSQTQREPLPLFSNSPVAARAPKEAELSTIEDILASGLEGVYAHMDASTKDAFKKQGEVTASRIQTLLHTATVQVQKIFSLILAWLRMIPKVNKFFLEQEAKIKTDKIMALPH